MENNQEKNEIDYTKRVVENKKITTEEGEIEVFSGHEKAQPEITKRVKRRIIAIVIWVFMMILVVTTEPLLTLLIWGIIIEMLAISMIVFRSAFGELHAAKTGDSPISKFFEIFGWMLLFYPVIRIVIAAMYASSI
ncbi:hypothetical protein ACFL2R_03305 [Patescibacteria group bacterium]